MKIRVNGEKRMVYYRDIENGECFICNKVYYLKTWGSEEVDGSAVNIKTGEIDFFTGDEPVQPINATFDVWSGG